MMPGVPLHILILVSLMISTPVVADQNLKHEFATSAVLSDSDSNQTSAPHKKQAADGIPIAIPAEKGAQAEIRMLSGQKSSTTSNPLMLAVQSGDISAVQKALQSTDTNIHARDDLGRTSLMFAAQRGYTDIVNTLLDAGSDPNAIDQQNQTALTYAAMTGHEKIIQHLVEANANIEVFDANGRTPLIWAIISRNTSSVSQILKAGANVNRPDIKGVSPLVYSLSENNPDNTRLLIDAGADVDVVLKKSNMNTLMLAAMQGDTDIIQTLIKKGIDVNSRTTAGVTPLLAAIVSNNKAATKLLLDSGARLNDKDKVGRSAIFYSANAKIDPKIAQILIEKGADINITENNGFTPLSLAAANGNMPVVKLLVASGLSANGAGSEGDFKPLMAASANNQAAIVEQLLTYKPEIDARDKHGKTALMWAAQYNCLKCVELLLSNGVNVNLVDTKNKSALDYATQNKKAKKIVELLESQKQ